MAVYLVIFGAGVRDDGTPSGTLRRRCEHAVAVAGRIATPVFLATGGGSRGGPTEASVVRDLLVERGVAPSRILLEEDARDTLESVRFCTRLLRSRTDVDRILVCSSSYHNPRCVLLFRLAGFDSAAEPMVSDRPSIGWVKWLSYVAKEYVVTPWDAAILVTLRLASAI